MRLIRRRPAGLFPLRRYFASSPGGRGRGGALPDWMQTAKPVPNDRRSQGMDGNRDYNQGGRGRGRDGGGGEGGGRNRWGNNAGRDDDAHGMRGRGGRGGVGRGGRGVGRGVGRGRGRGRGGGTGRFGDGGRPGPWSNDDRVERGQGRHQAPFAHGAREAVAAPKSFDDFQMDKDDEQASAPWDGSLQHEAEAEAEADALVGSAADPFSASGFSSSMKADNAEEEEEDEHEKLQQAKQLDKQKRWERLERKSQRRQSKGPMPVLSQSGRKHIEEYDDDFDDDDDDAKDDVPLDWLRESTPEADDADLGLDISETTLGRAMDREQRIRSSRERMHRHRQAVEDDVVEDDVVEDDVVKDDVVKDDVVKQVLTPEGWMPESEAKARLMGVNLEESDLDLFAHEDDEGKPPNVVTFQRLVRRFLYEESWNGNMQPLEGVEVEEQPLEDEQDVEEAELGEEEIDDDDDDSNTRGGMNAEEEAIKAYLLAEREKMRQAGEAVDEEGIDVDKEAKVVSRLIDLALAKQLKGYGIEGEEVVDEGIDDVGEEEDKDGTIGEEDEKDDVDRVGDVEEEQVEQEEEEEEEEEVDESVLEAIDEAGRDMLVRAAKTKEHWDESDQNEWNAIFKELPPIPAAETCGFHPQHFRIPDGESPLIAYARQRVYDQRRQLALARGADPSEVELVERPISRTIHEDEDVKEDLTADLFAATVSMFPPLIKATRRMMRTEAAIKQHREVVRAVSYKKRPWETRGQGGGPKPWRYEPPKTPAEAYANPLESHIDPSLPLEPQQVAAQGFFVSSQYTMEEKVARMNALKRTLRWFEKVDTEQFRDKEWFHNPVDQEEELAMLRKQVSDGI